MYDQKFMIELVRARMPFGKYKDRYITELPVHYLEWFAREGFPAGKLGQFISTVHEVKQNGLSDILKPIIRDYR